MKVSKPGGPGSGFHIEGFPDAAKVALLKTAAARRISHLVLHIGDLSFAQSCLQTLAEGQTEPTRSALWNSAIVSFMKCFGNSKARFSLDSKRVYLGNALALENFAFFKAMRNKHFAHDENPFLQALPGAIINRPGASNKIAKIVTFAVRADVLGQENFTNLRLLVEGAKAWAIAQHDQLCETVTADLERKAHKDLIALPNMEYRKPEVIDATKERT